MRRIVLTLVFVLSLAGALPALGAPNPSGHGRPDQSCEQLPNGPPGFETPGFMHAQDLYSSTSQYDVACYQLSSH